MTYAERSHIDNGQFLHDLDNWTASDAAYNAGDGDEHYGVAVLETGGGYVEQDFTVPDAARTYTLEMSVKAVGSDLSAGEATIAITDNDGNALPTINLSGTADTWTVNTNNIGLASGTTYTIRITNVSAAGQIKLDDVWLWYVPITRATIAAQVHARLARLATQRSLSTTASGSQTEGDYTYAVDAGLRAVGAIALDTDKPDPRYLTSNDVDAVLDATEQYMLEQLHRDFAVETDIAIGPRREMLSQIAERLGEITGADQDQAGGRVFTRKLRYKARDYDLG